MYNGLSCVDHEDRFADVQGGWATGVRAVTKVTNRKFLIGGARCITTASSRQNYESNESPSRFAQMTAAARGVIRWTLWLIKWLVKATGQGL